jgi:pimeloyl-ACP methyl ester carboxylesterase
MTEKNPVILIHGYSDQGTSFLAWKEALVAAGYRPDQVHICEYKSLTNEVTIKDVAEGFDRALRSGEINLPENAPFDAIVHSTGMLVIRSWLSIYRERATRLKRLVALAPATHGSPLAHKGRGFLGAVFKGNRVPGPDFMEAGNAILDGLELGSRFTWDLTHVDLLGSEPVFTREDNSPFVFIMCGTQPYGGLRALANEKGTDGTVRWSGVSLNTQKIIVDLSRDPDRMLGKRGEALAPQGSRDQPLSRFRTSDLSGAGVLEMPFIPIEGKDHATIIGEPDGLVLDLVLSALRVTDASGFDAWLEGAKSATAATMEHLAASGDVWQQFVVRAVDERGDPITDYYVELFTEDGPLSKGIDFDLNVHAYTADPSLRCFHVNLDKLRQSFPDRQFGPLRVRVIASSGSRLVGYHGLHSERVTPDLMPNPGGVWDAVVDLPATFGRAGLRLFFPFTTTFVELRLNRDPMPFGTGRNEVCYFIPT